MKPNLNFEIFGSDYDWINKEVIPGVKTFNKFGTLHNEVVIKEEGDMNDSSIPKINLFIFVKKCSIGLLI